MSTPPNYSVLGNCNSANYDQNADWNDLNGNLTSVGSNGGSSYYGTFDQNGNTWEIIDYQNGQNISIYGGSFLSNINDLTRLTNITTVNSLGSSDRGFRICSSTSKTDNDFVLVEDINNISNPINFLGSVAYSYKISKYLITNSQYVNFLNSIARNHQNNLYTRGGTAPIWPFDARMYLNTEGGIVQEGVSPNITYSVKTNMADKPVNFVNWYDAARYVNWLHNNKPNTGTLTTNSTETGAYTLNFTNPNPIPILSISNKNSYWIPNRNEWTKAAYYDPLKNGTGGYWNYATMSDSSPDSVTSNSFGIANNTVLNPNSCLTQTPTPSFTPTNTVTPTVTASVTVSNTSSPTPSSSVTPTVTQTPSFTPTKTPTVTPTVTKTSKVTPTPTKTTTKTPNVTPTVTPSITASPSNTPSFTPTKTLTPTPSKSLCENLYLGQLLYHPTIYNNEEIKVLYKGISLVGKLNEKIVKINQDPNVTPTPTPSTTSS